MHRSPPPALARSVALVVAVVAGLLAGPLAGRAARADDEEVDDATSAWSQRVSLSAAALSNHSWGALPGGGPGGAVQLAYDVFPSPSHGVGVVAGTGIDFGSYGGDKESVSWREGGLRYTYALVRSEDARWRPFASLGVALGRTGGELQSTYWMSTAFADVGLEWLATRHLSLSLRAGDRASRIGHPAGPWWHNSLAGTLDVAVRLPL